MEPAADTPPTWVRNLAALLRKVEVPLVELVARDGALTLVLATPGRPRLVVDAAPGRGDARTYATAGHFAIGYHGARSLGLEEQRAVDRVVALFTRLAERIPGGWQGAWVLGDAGDPPAEALRRRFPFVTVETVSTPEGPASEVLVRTTPRCNQSCPFCSGPPHAEPSGSTVLALLRAVGGTVPGALITLTGGEPTLRADFADLVRAGLAAPSVAELQVQTNAVGFARAGSVEALPTDARLRFFVSLHAVDEALYDALTGSRGQLPRALAGIRALLSAGHAVTLNALAAASNLSHLSDWVAALPGLLDGLPRPRLHFSVLICPEYNPQAAQHLAPYPALVQALTAASSAGRAAGFHVDPLAASTHAVIPLCLLPADQRAEARRRLVVQPGQTGYDDPRTPWTKASTCRACAVRDACLGVPAAYARRFGLAELSPLGEG
jgi:pyruvate-formate lyase-activating enzyme